MSKTSKIFPLSLGLIFASVLITSLFFSCTNNPNTQHQKKDLPTIHLSEVYQSEDYYNIFKSFKYIPLETTPECLIGNIEKIEMLDDHLIIFDRFVTKKIFVFNINGKFITTLGERGKGPGEYSMLSDFDISPDGKSIFLLDRGPRRIMQFNNKFEHIKTFAYDFYTSRFLNLGEDNFLFFNGVMNNKKVSDKNYRFFQWSYPNGEIHKQFQANNILDKIRANFERIRPYENKFIYHPFLNDTIFEVGDSSVNPLFRVTLEGETPTAKDFKHCKDHREFGSILRKKNYPRLKSFRFTDNIIILRYTINQMGYQSIIDRKNFSYKNIRYISNKRCLDGPMFIGSGKDFLISLIHTPSLLNWYNSKTRKNPDYFKLPENQKILRNLKEENNPVLVIHYLK
ncbi:6-bladed beta-propeller [Puteibacter caeruleilacunae]|nr:6-bladed beta-propeller [Puteibacter caeruleilacunae]